ncbi:MAG: hypothetical protein DMF99_31515 [Acidobacteria bacterium]|nr:MAG: hypothetical protein DMF99_31515 [Acidobacteriota bacterium]
MVLALGERDSDSLDSYHGPVAWQAEVRAERPTLPQIRAAAATLADSLKTERAAAQEDAPRRAFLIGQLEAVASRVDVLQGARHAFDEEARLLFGLDPHEQGGSADGPEDAGRELQSAAVRAELDRLLPGRGDLAARYAAFDRQFLVAPDRLAAVFSRAIEGCRAATRQHIALPAGERVDVDYVRDLPWSAFTRYEGRFVSRVLVNAALPLTVDRALDLACHETYPGHHTIGVLLDSRFGERRPELFVQPPSGAARHVAVGRLVDRLWPVEADVTRRYLDGALDFPRAAAALEREALMPSAEATLKFVNQFRSYAATYTIGRDRLSRVVSGSWAAYVRAVTDPAQILPRAPAR